MTGLIPLYAIGVFLSFTLSQGGMARRWHKSGQLAPDQAIHEAGSPSTHDPRSRVKMVVNGLGAVATAVVMLVFAITKFQDGAWIILVLIPLLVAMFLAIHHHYKDLAARLSLEDLQSAPARIAPACHHADQRCAPRNLDGAALCAHAIAGHYRGPRFHRLSRCREGAAQMGILGRRRAPGDLESPYRLLVEPLLQYIDKVDAQRQPNEIILVVVPEFVPRHRWEHLLHTQAALVLRLALRSKPGIIVMDVPYQLDR